jgi:hypothetical protein
MLDDRVRFVLDEDTDADGATHSTALSEPLLCVSKPPLVNLVGSAAAPDPA